MARFITPVTIDQYRSDDRISRLSSITDYYVTDLEQLDQWRSLPPMPRTQTWCIFNSFNLTCPRVSATLEGLEDPDWCAESKVLHPVYIDVNTTTGAGDVLMITSFIRQFRHQWPDTEIYVNIEERHKDLLLCNPDAHVKWWDYVGRFDLMFTSMRVWPRQDQNRVYNFHMPQIIRPILQQAQTLGWDHYDWKGLMAGVKVVNKWPVLDMQAEDYRPASKVKEKVAGRRKLVALHVAATVESRTYHRWPELVARLQRRKDVIQVILGGEESKPIQGQGVLNLAGKLTYRQTAGILNICDCLVCVDSIVSHLSFVHQKPTLVLFGDTPYTWAMPRNQNAQYLEGKRVDHIEPEDIMAWVEEKLDG